jgi:hypothetical protein
MEVDSRITGRDALHCRETSVPIANDDIRFDIRLVEFRNCIHRGLSGIDRVGSTKTDKNALRFSFWLLIQAQRCVFRR